MTSRVNNGLFVEVGDVVVNIAFESEDMTDRIEDIEALAE